MKYYVMVLLLLMGLVAGVSSAAKFDAKVMGTWISNDRLCRPCALTIEEAGVSFTLVEDNVTVLHAQGTNAGSFSFP